MARSLKPLALCSSFVYHLSVYFWGSIWTEGMQVRQSALYNYVLPANDFEDYYPAYLKCKPEETWFFLCFGHSALFHDDRDLYFFY